MATYPIRISLTSLALAAASMLMPLSAQAERVSCYGCYDGNDGKEHCKTVQVEGSCNVFTFCTAVGCSTSGSGVRIRSKLLSVPPSGAGSPAATQPKVIGPAKR